MADPLLAEPDTSDPAASTKNLKALFPLCELVPLVSMVSVEDPDGTVLQGPAVLTLFVSNPPFR